mmetsp:Transcript_16286/g.23952  ORF Transcript_16286/g.23952 Transcript_16286/m.23952 type:complete len:497 (-) Transcript_16286:1865-3355(-)
MMDDYDSEEDDDCRRLKNSRSLLSFLLSWLNIFGRKYQPMRLAGGTAILLTVSLITYRNQSSHKFNIGTRKFSRAFTRYLSSQLKKYRRYRIRNGYRNAAQTPLSVLWTEAKLGRVQQALLSSNSIAYRIQDDDWKISMLPSSSALQSNLVDTLAKHSIDVCTMPESFWSQIATPALAALPFVYLYFVYRLLRQQMDGKGDPVSSYDNTDTRTTFADVAGIDAAVREVSEVVSYLKNPERYTKIGAGPPRGILLYGPPGSGKTLLARAVAGEASATVFLACSGSAFCDTYVGRGANRVRQLFDDAKRQARKRHVTKWNRKPSVVIFIDEIDALAKARSSSSFGGNDERDQTLNELLTQVDGFHPNDDLTLIVIAATNRPDVLDPALLRRMDRQVAVGLPNLVGRQEILRIHARRIQCNIAGIDWHYLAQNTADFSGADLKNVTNEAALLAVRQRCTQVKHHHWIQAIQKIQQMKNSTTRGATTMNLNYHSNCQSLR